MSKIDTFAIFTYHAPFGTQPERYEAIRAAGKTFADLILASSPASREQSLALTNVQQAVQMTNAAIAIHEVQSPASVPDATDDSTANTPDALVQE